MKSVEERMRSKYVTQPNGCWLWTDHTTKGYGQVTINRIPRAAHRVAYELWVGPIPDGLHIDHLCNTPTCINPDHLEPVSCEVNLMRGTTTQARINSEKTHCPAGHPYRGSNLRLTPTGARYCLECKRLKKVAYDASRRAAR